MWIKSQDEETLIECKELFVRTFAAGYCQVCTISKCDDEVVVLGRYATKERAKEVLNEIWSVIARRKEFIGNYPLNDLHLNVNFQTLFLNTIMELVDKQNLVYEMPKE